MRQKADLTLWTFLTGAGVLDSILDGVQMPWGSYVCLQIVRDLETKTEGFWMMKLKAADTQAGPSQT